jgi:hypothetical protein
VHGFVGEIWAAAIELVGREKDFKSPVVLSREAVLGCLNP